MLKILWVLWPSFLVRGLAEGVFFTVIDPQELYLFGEPVTSQRIATYSIGFLGFWAVCAASSLMTCFSAVSAAELNKGDGGRFVGKAIRREIALDFERVSDSRPRAGPTPLGGGARFSILTEKDRGIPDLTATSKRGSPFSPKAAPISTQSSAVRCMQRQSE
jgi:hypothetical protein